MEELLHNEKKLRKYPFYKKVISFIAIIAFTVLWVGSIGSGVVNEIAKHEGQSLEQAKYYALESIIEDDSWEMMNILAYDTGADLNWFCDTKGFSQVTVENYLTGELVWSHEIDAQEDAQDATSFVYYYAFDRRTDSLQIISGKSYQLIPGREIYKIQIGLPAQLVSGTECSWVCAGFDVVHAMSHVWVLTTIVGIAGMIICWVWSIRMAGRKSNQEEAKAYWETCIPFDLQSAIFLIIDILLAVGAVALLAETSGWYAAIVAAIVLCCLWESVIIFWSISLAIRIKTVGVLKKTLIGRFLRWIFHGTAEVFRNASMMKKIIIGLIAWFVVEAIILGAIANNGNYIGPVVGWWFIEKIILYPIILRSALHLLRIKKAGAAFASGNLEYQIDTKGMHWDVKEHAENLNQIADGLNVAVEERMKSERMKTELITNVSHDIKTPLTSIINYTDLILKEPCENEKIKEYGEVLGRQSNRLKRLIEDLVEASKASTGNLEVDLLPLEANIFLNQAGGEFQEKLEKSQLTLVTKQPEESIYIMADGRRMWRIFDNLMNNICKYSQPGTRVYLALEQVDRNAVITFKNTSREELDLNPEELMERFVRGDKSRNTEGSGLGLAIARSLAELQGGELSLATDGDLFKATLKFPMI